MIRAVAVRLFWFVMVFVAGILAFGVFAFWWRPLGWPPPTATGLLAVFVSAAAIPLTVWRWHAVRSYVGTGGLNSWTVGWAMVGSAVFALSGVALLFGTRIPFLSLREAFPGLGLAYLGFATAFGLMACDVESKVRVAHKAGIWHDSPPAQP